MRIAFLSAGLAALLSASWGIAGDREPSGWSMSRAAKYLDERGKTWFAFSSAQRGSRANQTVCISCHTLLPFALGRPVLRQLAGDPQPTEYETRLLDRTRTRVDHWQELDSKKFQLFYSSDDDKKRESWGTEAILNVLVLSLADRSEHRHEASAHTKKAFANLWQVQSRDGTNKGSWDWLNFGMQPWESAQSRYFGATLAALAIGTAPGYYVPGKDAEVDRGVHLLRDYLRAHLPDQNLYNRIYLLWAAAKVPGLLMPAEQQIIVQAMLDGQHGDGGWNLASLGKYERQDGSAQSPDSDGYATGLALHVLQTAGLGKNKPQVAHGLDWLRSHQSSGGEWRTESVNKKRDPASHAGKFMSDAATAYAILALSD